jgi:hypothetical protein
MQHTAAVTTIRIYENMNLYIFLCPFSSQYNTYTITHTHSLDNRNNTNVVHNRNLLKFETRRKKLRHKISLVIFEFIFHFMYIY